VYLWVGVAIGIYVKAQVCKPGYCLYCLIVDMDCSWSNYETKSNRLSIFACVGLFLSMERVTRKMMST